MIFSFFVLFFEKVNVLGLGLKIVLFEFVKNKWSKLDLLINNAGIEDDYLLQDQTYEKYRKTMKVNLDAPFLCSKYCFFLEDKANFIPEKSLFSTNFE